MVINGLKKQKLTPFSINEIEPKGWLKRQLQIQSEGLCGNLHLVWRDIKDSKWIGGEAEGWERVPYWLDGFIPLAYLLNDKEKISVSKRYIYAIIKNQAEDGWICPTKSMDERKTYDVWAAFLIGKVLTVYADCSGDNIVDDVIYKMLKNLYEHIKQFPIFDWAKHRWFECLIPIFWMYKRVSEGWLLDFARLLKEQGFDYKAQLEKTSMKKYKKRHYWNQNYHVVNLAMAIKSLSLYSQIEGEEDDKDFAYRFIGALFKHHGMPNGHFSGDECLNGRGQNVGTELCGVVEAMFSYENLIALTGDTYWADLLEILCFNALPATLTCDMWAHQYDQMANQPFAAKIPDKKVPFTSNQGQSNNYGLEPNFGCCTANFNQGFPKFALSQFFKDDKGIYIYSLAPSKLNTTFNGTPLSIEVITDYPFKEHAKILVKSVGNISLRLGIRIPGFVDNALVDNSTVTPGNIFIFDGEIDKEKEIIISLSSECKLKNEVGEGYYLKKGALYLSLNVKKRVLMHEYTKDGIVRKHPYCDYEMFPASKWNYAFCDDTEFEVCQKEIPNYPFSEENCALSVKATLAEIKWKAKNNFIKSFPKRLKPLQKEQVEFLPYGCTDLRMTLLPLLPTAKKN